MKIIIDDSFLECYKQTLERARENLKFSETEIQKAFYRGCINELKGIIEHVEHLAENQK